MSAVLHHYHNLNHIVLFYFVFKKLEYFFESFVVVCNDGTEFLENFRQRDLRIADDSELRLVFLDY